jgi:hypothetical protein
MMSMNASFTRSTPLHSGQRSASRSASRANALSLHPSPPPPQSPFNKYLLPVVTGIIASVVVNTYVPPPVHASEIDRIVTIEESRIPYIEENMNGAGQQAAYGISSILDQVEEEITTILENPNFPPPDLAQQIEVIEQQMDMIQSLVQ